MQDAVNIVREPAALGTGRPEAAEEDRRSAAFYEAHADAVFRLSLRLCGGRRADAEDVAQEALIAALAALPRFAGRARLTTWLHTITVRTWRRHCAQQGVVLPSYDEAAPAARGTAPGDEDRRLTRMTIDAAVAALPDALREAFVLVKVEGLTHREAARVLETPQGTVQARVHEAARRLRAALGETEGKESR